jgi:hypothetical protein
MPANAAKLQTVVFGVVSSVTLSLTSVVLPE